MKINGLQQVGEGFRNLANTVVKKIARKALRAGGKVTLNVARATAPVKTGNTARNVKLRSVKTPNGSTGIGIGVGARDWRGGPTWYAVWVIEGHYTGKRVKVKSSGKADGKAKYHALSVGKGRHWVKGNDWLQRALASTQTSAVETFRDTALQLIDQAAANGGKL